MPFSLNGSNNADMEAPWQEKKVSAAHGCEDEERDLFGLLRVLSGHQLAIAAREGLEGRAAVIPRVKIADPGFEQEGHLLRQAGHLLFLVGEGGNGAETSGLPVASLFAKVHRRAVDAELLHDRLTIAAARSALHVVFAMAGDRFDVGDVERQSQSDPGLVAEAGLDLEIGVLRGGGFPVIRDVVMVAIVAVSGGSLSGVQGL
ncbi:hypothetical protein GGQ90_005938, partial [Sphingobium scionense]|nr:hypothetical protein [Sphingobium scionense]